MATYSVRIIKAPDYIIGGPFMVQVVTDGALKVAALRTGIATRERAEQVAAEYRRAYPPAPAQCQCHPARDTNEHLYGCPFYAANFSAG